MPRVLLWSTCMYMIHLICCWLQNKDFNQLKTISVVFYYPIIESLYGNRPLPDCMQQINCCLWESTPGGCCKNTEFHGYLWPSGSWQTLRNVYLWNCWKDFLSSKLYEIVKTWSCATSWSFAHWPHLGLPMGQKLVGPDFVDAYLWNCWTYFLCLKFYGIV